MRYEDENVKQNKIILQWFYSSRMYNQATTLAFGVQI